MNSKIQIRCIKLENNKFTIDTTDPNYTIFQTQVQLIQEAANEQLAQFNQQQPRFIYRRQRIHNLEYLNIDKDTELPEN